MNSARSGVTIGSLSEWLAWKSSGLPYNTLEHKNRRACVQGGEAMMVRCELGRVCLPGDPWMHGKDWSGETLEMKKCRESLVNVLQICYH